MYHTFYIYTPYYNLSKHITKNTIIIVIKITNTTTTTTNNHNHNINSCLPERCFQETVGRQILGTVVQYAGWGPLESAFCNETAHIMAAQWSEVRSITQYSNTFREPQWGLLFFCIGETRCRDLPLAYCVSTTLYEWCDSHGVIMEIKQYCICCK